MTAMSTFLAIVILALLIAAAVFLILNSANRR